MISNRARIPARLLVEQREAGCSNANRSHVTPMEANPRDRVCCSSWTLGDRDLKVTAGCDTNDKRLLLAWQCPREYRNVECRRERHVRPHASITTEEPTGKGEINDVAALCATQCFHMMQHTRCSPQAIRRTEIGVRRHRSRRMSKQLEHSTLTAGARKEPLYALVNLHRHLAFFHAMQRKVEQFPSVHKEFLPDRKVRQHMVRHELGGHGHGLHVTGACVAQHVREQLLVERIKARDRRARHLCECSSRVKWRFGQIWVECCLSLAIISFSWLSARSWIRFHFQPMKNRIEQISANPVKGVHVTPTLGAVNGVAVKTADTMARARASQGDGYGYAVAMLISGTFSTVIMKTEYGIRAEGVELCADPANPRATTTNCPFDKPWFGVLQMKLAMALCLVFLYLRKVVKHTDYLETPLLRLRKHGNKYLNTPEATAVRNKQRGRQTPQESTSLLRGDDATQSRVSLKTMAAVALPSLLDLLQTVFANVGLLWISSSVYQMARGSVIIFSAIFSVKLMNKRLYAYHYASILVVAISVVLVGWAGTKSSSTGSTGSDSNAIWGLTFIVMAQLLTALQIVVEEHMMIALNVSPMLLVGLEGLWGLVFYIVLVPVLTLTPPATTAFSKIWHEDFYDSMVKLSNSPPLIALIVCYIIAVGTLNVTGNYVTKHLSAVMRSIAETLRTLGVWMLGLFVFYVVQWRGPNSPGEEWTTSSWIELLGFVLMVYGTLSYKKLIQIPISRLYASERREYAAATYKSPFMSGMHK